MFRVYPPVFIACIAQPVCKDQALWYFNTKLLSNIHLIFNLESLLGIMPVHSKVFI